MKGRTHKISNIIHIIFYILVLEDFIKSKLLNLSSIFPVMVSKIVIPKNCYLLVPLACKMKMVFRLKTTELRLCEMERDGEERGLDY
jgi:hypothetical protein